jgi:hypothetical protein
LKILGFALLSLLASCAVPSQQASHDNVSIVWNKVDDPHVTCQNLNGRKEVFAIRGCSKWNESNRSGARVCNIYARAPKSENDTQAFATLGHELMHCFDGNWHDRWGRMTPREGQAAVGGSSGADTRPASSSN